MWCYLEESIEDFEDLLLYQNRVTRVVREELDKTTLKHGHEKFHGGYQRLTLFWFFVSVSHTATQMAR